LLSKPIGIPQSFPALVQISQDNLFRCRRDLAEDTGAERDTDGGVVEAVRRLAATCGQMQRTICFIE